MKTETKKKSKKKILLTVLMIFLALAILGAAAVFLINSHMKSVAAPKILTAEQAAELEDVDCILVLGCRVYNSGAPSPMLEDRLLQGIDLYERGAASKLLMSGDHGQEEYDEVNNMKQYAIDKGVPSEDIFMDHAGFSTYESMYRARDIFSTKKVIIVTQEYHLYRAIYIAEKLGLEAYGVASDLRPYSGRQIAREAREILARVKDFCTTIIQPKPTYLGDVIPIWGSGDLTNDK